MGNIAEANLFVNNILHTFSDYKYLKQRIKILYSLFGLKWCLIFLNEFIPDHFLRRDFAHNHALDKKQLQKIQLEKAQRLLHTVQETYKAFPYVE